MTFWGSAVVTEWVLWTILASVLFRIGTAAEEVGSGPPPPHTKGEDPRDGYYFLSCPGCFDHAERCRYTPLFALLSSLLFLPFFHAVRPNVWHQLT